MTRRPAWLVCSLACFAAAAVAQAPAVQDPAVQDPAVLKELKALRERVDELEEHQSKLSERVGSRAIVQPYTAKAFDFGGQVSSLFTYMSGDGGATAGHLVTLAELYLKAQINDEWSLFAAPGFYTFNGGLLDNPATPANASDPTLIRDDVTQSRTFLSRIYGQWKPNDAFQVQGGIIGSPHGTTNREYFIPSRMIAQANLHTRLFLSNQLYPQLIEGLRASGKITVGSDDWVDYDVYYGTEPDSSSDGIGGARLAYVFGKQGLTVAANYGSGTRQGSATPATNFGALQSPFPNTFNSTRDYRLAGVDIDWRKGAFMMKSEGYYSMEAGFADQIAASSEWTWFAVDALGLTYRFDYYDSGSDLNVFALAVTPRGIATEHVVGLCYNPDPSVRLRLDMHHINLPNTGDAVQFVNFSWSISF